MSSIIRSNKLKYVANTISCNMSSEETTYSVMKYSSAVIYSVVSLSIFWFPFINVVKMSSASCCLISIILKLCLTNDYVHNFLFYNILPNPKSL